MPALFSFWIESSCVSSKLQCEQNMSGSVHVKTLLEKCICPPLCPPLLGLLGLCCWLVSFCHVE